MAFKTSPTKENSASITVKFRAALNPSNTRITNEF